METWIVVIVFFLGNVTQVTGDYDVSVKLLGYNRDRDCSCDPKGWLFKCGECDVYFQVCLQPLLPTQRQVCYGNDENQRVDDDLFANALRNADSYTWRNITGQPSFNVSFHAYDYDYVNGSDDLGVTSFVYRGNTVTGLIFATRPGNKNLRIILELTVFHVCPIDNSGLQCGQKEKTTMTEVSTSITSTSLEKAKTNAQSELTSPTTTNIQTATHKPTKTMSNTPAPVNTQNTSTYSSKTMANISTPANDKTPLNKSSPKTMADTSIPAIYKILTTNTSASTVFFPSTTTTTDSPPTTLTTAMSSSATTQTTIVPTRTKTVKLPSTATTSKATIIEKWLPVIVGVSAAVLLVIIGAVTSLCLTKSRFRRINPEV